MTRITRGVFLGLVDAVLFLVFWSFIALVLKQGSSDFLTQLISTLMILLCPALILFWRSYKSFPALLNNTFTQTRAVTEGILYGNLVCWGLLIGSMFNHANAAGTVIDGLSPISSQFWMNLAPMMGASLLFTTPLSALHGIFFFHLNRWTVKKWLS
jgi:di/tricarboxylate transporter